MSPTKPARACPRCGGLIVGRASCPNCRRPYTRSWNRLSQDFRARFPFCGLRADNAFHGEHSACARAGQKTLAAVVDHITPIVDGGAVFDESNLQALCLSCHYVKSGAERGTVY